MQPDIRQPVSLGAVPEEVRWRRVGVLLRRRWWLPLLLAGLAFTGAAAWLLTRPEMFLVVSRMWVGGKLQVPAGAVYSEEWQNFFGTQIELMESPRVRRRAFERVRELNQSTNTEPIEVSVSQPRKSATFVLSAEGEDPIYLEAYLNAIMDEYLAYRREVRAATSLDTVAGLTDQLATQERQLQAAQEKLAAFLKEHNAVALQDEGVSAAAYLARLNSQLADFRLEHGLLTHTRPEDLLGAGPRLAAATIDTQGARELNLTGGVIPPEYLTARQQLEMLRIERTDLARHLRDEHPKMIRLDEQIRRAEQLIEVFRNQTEGQLQSTRDALERKIETTGTLVAEWENRVVEINRRQGEYERLKMEVVRMQSLYDHLIELVQKVDVNTSFDQESVNVLDRASSGPGGSRWYVLAGAAGFAALMAGLGLVLLQERLDGRVLAAGDLKTLLPGTLLASIPRVRVRRGMEVANDALRAADRILLLESFRVLRAAVQNRLRGTPPPRLLLITSAVPGEGKSTVSLHLARALAFAGRRVLLVDADLRQSRLTGALTQEDELGLTDYLGGRAEARAVVHPTDVPNLFLLPAGASGTQADELLDAAVTDRLLIAAAATFEFVILDSPPLLGSADAAALAPHCHGVLLVAAEGISELSHLLEASELLEQRGAHLAGLVLNRSRSIAHGYQRYGRIPATVPAAA